MCAITSVEQKCRPKTVNFWWVLPVMDLWTYGEEGGEACFHSPHFVSNQMKAPDQRPHEISINLLPRHLIERNKRKTRNFAETINYSQQEKSASLLCLSLSFIASI